MMINQISMSEFFKKAILYFIKMVGGLLLFMALFVIFYWYNNRLFLWEASILWKQIPFNEKMFKEGSTDDRARMVVDLIQGNTLIGVDTNQIQTKLGKINGDYYHSESNLTYRLSDKGHADWVLTFVSDGEGKIQSIFIRKSCCSISKKFLFEVMNFFP